MSKNLLAEIFALSAQLIKTARAQNVTLATAESCTGGLIGAAITATAGSSSIFHGGIIAYHNDVKINLLGVCLLYTSPSPRDKRQSRMPSSA